MNSISYTFNQHIQRFAKELLNNITLYSSNLLNYIKTSPISNPIPSSILATTPKPIEPIVHSDPQTITQIDHYHLAKTQNFLAKVINQFSTEEVPKRLDQVKEAFNKPKE
jgi:hypothetical protein